MTGAKADNFGINPLRWVVSTMLGRVRQGRKRNTITDRGVARKAGHLDHHARYGGDPPLHRQAACTINRGRGCFQSLCDAEAWHSILCGLARLHRLFRNLFIAGVPMSDLKRCLTLDTP